MWNFIQIFSYACFVIVHPKTNFTFLKLSRTVWTKIEFNFKRDSLTPFKYRFAWTSWIFVVWLKFKPILVWVAWFWDVRGRSLPGREAVGPRTTSDVWIRLKSGRISLQSCTVVIFRVKVSCITSVDDRDSYWLWRLIMILAFRSVYCHR